MRLSAPSRSAPAARLGEVFGPADCGAGLGFLLTQLPRDGRVLWVRDWVSQREAGGLYLPQVDLVTVNLSHPRDVLIAMEEGLRCSALAAVVGEIWGNPAVLSFTATKRLALRAETHGVPCWLLRRGAERNLSAARDRWAVEPLPSAQNPDDALAPGDPRWQVELFRSRDKQPGYWAVRHDRTADHLDFAAPSGDGDLAAPAGTAGERAG